MALTGLQSLTLALVGVALVLAGVVAVRMAVRWRRRVGQPSRARIRRVAEHSRSQATWDEVLAGIDHDAWDWNQVCAEIAADEQRGRDMTTPDQHVVRAEPLWGSVVVDPVTGEFVYTPFSDAPNGTVDAFQLGSSPEAPPTATFDELLHELGDGWVEVLIEDGRATVTSSSVHAASGSA